MQGNSTISATIDESIKNEAAEVLAEVGLSVSDACRLLLIRIATEKTVVFDPLIPNKKTIAAMNDAREGRVRIFDSVEDLFDDLNASD